MIRIQLIIVALMLIVAQYAAIQADEKTAATGKTSSILIGECRIVLIDQVTLACERPGILKTIECKEGQPVQAGQRLALIADEVARANLAIAEKKATNDVDVRIQRKASEIADVEHRRNAEANKKAAEAGRGIPVATLDVEKLRLTAEKATLSVEEAEQNLAVNKLTAEVARAELATYSVMSEIEGVVTRVYRKRGEAVRQGDPIVEVVNPNRVRVEGRIALPNLKHARQGAKVKVKLAIPDLDLPEEREEFEGHITFVDLTADPVTHETRVFAEVNNRENILRAGLRAEMILEPTSK